MKRLKLIFFGSGAFGLPTLEALVAAHDVALVVSQPDRPAGRGRTLTPTPIAEWSARHRLALRKPTDVNAADEIAAIRAARADAFVVIAFGQKLSAELLGPTFAINLHGSLLPAYRGAAPINWAMIDGCAETGVSVIALAQRMDAGAVFETRRVAIDPLETAGDLHDRLALLGPEAVGATLEHFASGTARGVAQDEGKATRARKLKKEDGRIDLAQMTAQAARCRVHGLLPWPGCDVMFGSTTTRLLRVRDHADGGETAGTVLADGSIACRSGRLEILELQPQGGRPMTFEEFRRGHRVGSGDRVLPIPNVGAVR